MKFDIANKRTLLSVWYMLTLFSIIPLFYFATGELMLNSLVLKHSWLIVCMLVAGFAKAVSDTLKDHYTISIFNNFKNKKFWDYSNSWINKYEIKFENSQEVVTNVRRKWLGVIPIPVFITDGWHLAQHFMITSIVFGCVCYEPYFTFFDAKVFNFFVDVLFIRAVFGIGFYASYNWYLIKKEYRIK